jgi:ring-1,2-phenylacetyl-CoA epoxidase subunit PaaA
MLQLNPNQTGIGNVTPDDFFTQNDEFTKLQLNIIAIHVVSEEFGADTFEQSILRAPTADMKMRMAKTVMEEYGHHLRFRKLLEDLKLDWEEVTKNKGHLSTFDVPIDTWADQMVFLALVDRAAAHQFRHFIKSPYEPFRRACQETLNEEYGHVGLGMDGVKDLLRTPEGKEEVAKSVMKWLPVGLASFGGANSKTNERYRHWGLKSDTNEGMRETYYQQVKAFITKEWGVPLPETADEFIKQKLGGNLSVHAIYVAG